MIKETCSFPLINHFFRNPLDPLQKWVRDQKLQNIYLFFVQVFTFWCLFLQLSVNTALRRKQLALLQIEEIHCSSLDLSQLQETFFQGYCYQLIMSCFPLALIQNLTAFTFQQALFVICPYCYYIYNLKLFWQEPL